MEFNNRMYELRKQKGLSQEELASRLNVSRQTVSKWENGESSPDMEKLVAISDLFELSLDELVLGKEQIVSEKESGKTEVLKELEEKVWTPENKKKVGKGVKIVGIAAGVLLAIDLLSMVIYFFLYGVPN